MKLKKNISKIIALSILLNNMCFYSNANSLSRYETLEGDIITLDDVDSKDITEIELFGNTVQNPNNLEDIQSVGDLYVNEEGEPILDELGRQQYMIEVESTRNIDAISTGVVSYSGKIEDYKTSSFTIKTTGTRWTGAISNSFYTQDFNCEYGEYFAMEFDGKLIEGNINEAIGLNVPTWLSLVDGFSTKLPTDGKYRAVFKSLTNPINSRKATLSIYTTSITTVTNPVTYQIDNLKIYKVDDFNDVYQSNKTTLLLPCQLMKIGKIADRLYWDNEKGKYIVEKNVKTTNLPVLGDIKSTLDSINGGCKYNSSFSNVIEWNNIFKGIGIEGANYWEGYQMHVDKQMIIIPGVNIISLYHNTWMNGSIKKGKLLSISNQSISSVQVLFRDTDCSDIEQMNEWVSSFQGKTAYYVSLIPELIETNLTEKIKLSTYEGRSYISTITENGINPALKLTVDRIKQTSQEAVDIALSKPTYNNITLARMFINMLPESLYKDQLQEQLNQLFSEDMVLDKKSVSSNLDLYIKSENILMMSLDTNFITFEDFSGTEDIERPNAINITVNSSLPYQVNAYLPNEIQNNDKSNTMSKDILNIKEGSEQTYKTFANINEKVILKDNCPAGNEIKHSIDLMLKGGVAHEKDVYKTTIKFEIEQK